MSERTLCVSWAWRFKLSFLSSRNSQQGCVKSIRITLHNNLETLPTVWLEDIYSMTGTLPTAEAHLPTTRHTWSLMVSCKRLILPRNLKASSVSHTAHILVQLLHKNVCPYLWSLVDVVYCLRTVFGDRCWKVLWTVRSFVEVALQHHAL